MADKIDLRPVPYENGSYYRLKGKKLIVEVKNYGKVAADATIRVIFPGYGTCKNPENRAPQVSQKKNVLPEKSVEFLFDCPSDNCFDPVCEFYIAVDAKSESAEESSVIFGVCFKPMRPDLVIIPNNKGEFLIRDDKQLKFTVQNQGTADAQTSITKIEIQGYSEIKVETPELQPGYTHEVSVKVPKGKAVGKGSKYKITLDIEGVLHVPDESHKPPRRPYEGEII